MPLLEVCTLSDVPTRICYPQNVNLNRPEGGTIGRLSVGGRIYISTPGSLSIKLARGADANNIDHPNQIINLEPSCDVQIDGAEFRNVSSLECRGVRLYLNTMDDVTAEGYRSNDLGRGLQDTQKDDKKITRLNTDNVPPEAKRHNETKPIREKKRGFKEIREDISRIENEIKETLGDDVDILSNLKTSLEAYNSEMKERSEGIYQRFCELRNRGGEIEEDINTSLERILVMTRNEFVNQDKLNELERKINILGDKLKVLMQGIAEVSRIAGNIVDNRRDEVNRNPIDDISAAEE